MKAVLLTSMSVLALAACTMPPSETPVKLDPTGTHYEAVPTSQPVNNSMRNSGTVNPTDDRMSGRYPVGSTPDSNAH